MPQRNHYVNVRRVARVGIDSAALPDTDGYSSSVHCASCKKIEIIGNQKLDLRTPGRKQNASTD